MLQQRLCSTTLLLYSLEYTTSTTTTTRSNPPQLPHHGEHERRRRLLDSQLPRSRYDFPTPLITLSCGDYPSPPYQLQSLTSTQTARARRDQSDPTLCQPINRDDRPRQPRRMALPPPRTHPRPRDRYPSAQAQPRETHQRHHRRHSHASPRHQSGPRRQAAFRPRPLPRQ